MQMRRQRHNSDVMSDVINTEEHPPEAVRANDDARDDHTGGLRDIGSVHINTHTDTHAGNYLCRRLVE